MIYLSKSYCYPSNSMVVRTPLECWEHSIVNSRFIVIENWIASLVHTLLSPPEEDHARPHSTQTFVCGGSDDICMVKRGGNDTPGHQTGYVGHVSQQHRLGLVTDGTEPARKY